jgi:hypothetical protein
MSQRVQWVQGQSTNGTTRFQFPTEARGFEVFTAVTMKNGVFWDVSPVALVRTDVWEDLRNFGSYKSHRA